jgi:hypothetical protein
MSEGQSRRHYRRRRTKCGRNAGQCRATVLRFAQEGTRIFAVDRDLESVDETASLARAEGGE